MGYYSYVVDRDYGFAPNPFYGFCTLATCKPRIRKGANIGDWIFGTGGARLKRQNRLIFAMKVTGRISFNEYWEHPQFQIKKPKMEGTLKNMYGDSIYHRSNGIWVQSDSHHSKEGGETNYKNLERDTNVDAVLISEVFFYFGSSAISIPELFIEHIGHRGRNHSRPDEKWGLKFIEFLDENYEYGYHGDPVQFGSFKRFPG